MELKILFVDDEVIRTTLFEYFNGLEIEEHLIIADQAETFELGLEKIKKNHYDIVVLDLCKGEPSKDADKEGLNILKEIQSHLFVPVIFFSGIANTIPDLRSEVVGVVNKGSDGITALKEEIKRIIVSHIALLKNKIHTHVDEELKKYFWDTIDKQKQIFKQGQNDYSLGYLMLRRLANSLSKDNIRAILGDKIIKEKKAHPMEFYIYPTNSEGEFEAGEILFKDGKYFAILTPDCDFIEDEKQKRNRRVGKVLLAIAQPLSENSTYLAFKKNDTTDTRRNLMRLIETRKGDQFFFLPKTPFIDNLILDFQIKTMVDFEELDTYQRITKLDVPYAQSMISSFIRYYNRIGFPDIDAEYVIASL